jgi:RNA polymerase primary sigma factor
MAKTETAEATDTTEAADAPLIDLNEASVKKLIARAKKKGYITYDELNAACRRIRCRPTRSRT